MPPKPPAPRLTHFLCIPLVTLSSKPQLQSNLASFWSDITKETPENPNGIPEKAIRPIGTLHLTLGVMSLATPSRLEEALKVLKGLNLRELMEAEPSKAAVQKVGGEGNGERKEGELIEPLKITLRGLQSMHTPSKTSILYTSPVDADKRLHSFCTNLKAAFGEADLLVKDTRPLLLHATLVNTVYVPGVRGKGTGHGKSRAKLTIDSRGLLEGYKEAVWMSDVRVEKVAICRMGAKRLENGEEEYGVEGELEMPV